ncbi:MAG: aminotransferase class I/II-fold pyridoxal phosphate-dependent enzyme [Thermocladium sp.]|nr:MAG: hypothetical protein AT710_03575 [Thermocladium sp. ECH_B]
MEIQHFKWLRTHSAPYNLSSSGMILLEPSSIEEMGRPGDVIDIIRNAYGAEDNGVMLVHGTQEGNFLALAAMRGKIDSVAIQVPEYEPIRVLPGFLGIKTVEISDAFQVPPHGLLFLSNPNNPTGSFIGEKALFELEEALERRGSYAVLDSIFLDFVNKSPRLWFRNMIFTLSTSKFYTMNGVKVGWVIGDPAILREMSGISDLISPGPLDLEAKYAAILVSNREWVRNRNLSIIRGNREELMGSIKELKSVELSYVPDMPIAFAKPSCGLSGMELANKLLSRGVMVVPGEYFGLRQGIRIGLGSINREIARIGLSIIRDVIKECDGP